MQFVVLLDEPELLCDNENLNQSSQVLQRCSKRMSLGVIMRSFVVISQTHRLVSQERLSPRVGTSIFIDLHSIMPSGEWWF